MKIVIDPFDSNSIKKAIEQLKNYKKEFQTKEQEFIKRLAEIGVSVAETGYQTADIDLGNKVPDVRMEERGNGYAVIAYGESVGFIEFGTGITNPEWNGGDIGYTPPAHGTYGKKRGANPKGWYYTVAAGAKSVHTYGMHPAEAMLTARNEMIERIHQIAQEVWR